MKLPKSWKEVPLKHYIEISELSFVDMDEIDKVVKILSILSGNPEESITELDIKTIAKLSKQVSFIYTKHNGKGVTTFVRLKGKRYRINNDIRSLSGSEYIDFTSLIKDKSEVAMNLPHILAIFFEPINFFGFRKKSCYKNGVQTLKSRAEIAKDLVDLPTDIAMDLSGFFLKSWEGLTKATQNYLMSEKLKTMKMLKKEAKDLENIGRGN